MRLPTIFGRGQTPPQPRDRPGSTLQRSRGALAVALFLFLLSVYLLTYSPRFHSSDGLAVFSTAESLVRRGEWDADQIRWMGLGQGILGVDGHLYTRKGVGQTLLALPLVWLGMLVPGWGAATTALLFNSLVTAATAVLLFYYLGALGYERGVALAAGLIFGLATLAWPYAKTFFSDPLAALCLLAAAIALLRLHQSERIAYAFGAGLALALSVAARYANAALIPLFGLALLAYQLSNSRTPVSSLRSLSAVIKSQNWRAWLAFAAPLAMAAIGLVVYNLVRFGDPFNTGYLPEESFSGVWWQGIAGLLVSPGRGLFLYAPVLLIALPAAPAFFRRHRLEATLAAAVILGHLLLYGKWFMWHGGYAWGPRFMVATLPFFVLAVAPAMEWATISARRWRGFLVLAGLSGLIQVLGLSVHFELFQNRLLDTGLPLFDPITFFAPIYSPLAGQLQFLRPEYLDFAWITNGRIDWPLLAALLALTLLSGWNLARIRRMDDRPAGSLYSSSLVLLAVLAITSRLLAQVHTLPTADLQEQVSLLNQRTSAADAIVTGTPEESAAFADLYKGHADVLGLNAGPPLDADTMVALRETIQQHPRVWWLPNWLPPAQSNIEQWLMQNGFRAEDHAIGEGRVALYYFPSEPLSERTVQATFGQNIILQDGQVLPALQPGAVLPVDLRWQASQPTADNYHVFVHLLDEQDQRIAQSDGQPALWTRPTSSWQPGEIIEDRHALCLPADLPPGDYQLIVGLYLPQNGQRLATGDGKSFASLGVIRVTHEDKSHQ
jgi:hypothetical protein